MYGVYGYFRTISSEIVERASLQITQPNDVATATKTKYAPVRNMFESDSIELMFLYVNGLKIKCIVYCILEAVTRIV